MLLLRLLRTKNATASEFLPLPIKYVFVSPEGEPQVPPSAFAGYALELLCKKDPSIKPLLTEGRSSVEGLRKLAQAIERITPGLYKRLQAGNYSPEGFGFYEKLSKVIYDVGGGIENAIIAKGLLKDTWDEILRAQK